LGVSQAVFVGHDLGGGVVQRLAVLYPHLCQGLMLTDCVAYDNWPVPPIMVAQQLSWLIEKLPPVLLKVGLLNSLRALGEADSPRRSESAQLHAALYGRAGGPAAFAKQVDSVNTLDTLNIASRLPDLRLPARVVWAEHDMLSLESGERLAADLRAPFTCLPNAKHFTPEDHPDVIARNINEVLAQVEQEFRSQELFLNPSSKAVAPE
jgi:pimeloyl-ACP methyl ester carboxylesterase